ncbi:transmembrane protein 53-A-like isoform X2 [Coccinella septempunctata]|uniref:transmembrane protein 53-A-like isoform X2 n=1 Tax=Coccinella septempunctata TaxID=41139 RepID=UPI001D09763D|nr:transmembrane protein 53-A-like isoform X2 [Coccinella septempunctata]XP_044762657.1 transmembrane protein 53-A-like isoform X2 [Coccinella septempunctata]
MENLSKSYLYVTPAQSKANTLNDQSYEPVVMLFGWMGAQDKYLRVYSQIYEEQGFPTVRLTVSPFIVLFKNNEMTEFSHKLVSLLEEPDFKDRPVIIHLFSNGGSFQYEVFLNTLDEAKRKLVKGVIFDSGPAKWTLYNSFTVCSMILSSLVSNKFLLYPLTVAAIASSASLVGLKKIQKKILKRPVYLMDPYNNLMNQENACPQLFFFSKADKLVPYRDMEVFIEKRKSRGVEVMYKIYETTQHVKHYPSDKLGYTKTVLNFLNKVLRK